MLHCPTVVAKEKKKKKAKFYSPYKGEQGPKMLEQV